MKVRLTHNGKAFGREMNREVALLYISITTCAVKGLHWEWAR
ncbi:hypothetical protein [Paenibacillus sp. Soil724D2]|nr:hypothetical protein [Paenibacillus sp. Soil724D2]